MSNGITYTIDFAAAIARLEEGTVKGSQAVRKMADQMESASNFAKSALAALGVTLSTGFFVNFLKGTVDAIAHMKELGQEAGTSAEAISRFEAPARTARLGLENVANAIFKMNTALLEAKDPQSKAALALKSIGLSVEQFKGLKPDEIFEKTARSLAKYGDGVSKNNVMQELFGKSGREMNRVVAEIAEQGKLSATVTNEQAEAAKLLDKQLVQLKMNSEQSWRSIVSEGVPALNAILKSFLDARREGNLLQGVIAAIQTGLTGTDQFKNDKELVELTEQKLVLENQILAAQNESAVYRGMSVDKLRKQLADVDAQIRTTLAMREALNAGQQSGEPPKTKPTIEFDPKKEADALKAAQAQANAIIAFNEQIAKDNAAMWDEANKDVLRNQEVILAARLDLEGRYAAALRDETLSEAENLNDFSRMQQEKTRIEEEEIKKRWGINQLYRQIDLVSASSFFGQLGAMMVSHNRAAFNIGKAAAISQTVIDTYRAAQGAYAALAGIPIVGPALGAAAAAAAIVVGMARVQQIRSTQFGGGGVGGGSVPTFAANPSTGIPTAPIGAQPGFGPNSGASPVPSVVINVITNANGPLVGSGGMEELTRDHIMPAMKTLVDELDELIAGPNSRQRSVILNGV